MSLPGDERAVLRAFFEETDARLAKAPFDHVYMWGNNEARVPLKGRRCRVLIWGGAMHTILVEFEDGAKATTSRNAVRVVREGAAIDAGLPARGDRVNVGTSAQPAGSKPSAAPSLTSYPSLFPMRKEANRD